MGSAPSSHVKTIQLDQSLEEDRPHSGKSLRSLGEKFKLPSSSKKRATDIQLEDCRKQLETYESDLIDAQSDAQDAQAKAASLEKQMAELEGQNLDLQDQVQNLQEHLELLLEAQDKVEESNDEQGECSETLRVKDQCIKKLEQDNTTYQEEIQKWKIKYKKKVKILNGKLAEIKHESSLETHELKTEIQQLQEERDKLTEQVRQMEIHGNIPLRKPDTELGQTVGRNRIVLDLSAKVSEQDEIIQNLERELEETKKKLKPTSGKKEDRKISSSAGPTRPKYVSNSPRSGSESNLRNVAFVNEKVQDTNKSHIQDIEFNEETQWCARLEAPGPGLAEPGTSKDPVKKFSTWAGDGEGNSELKHIAREMKKLQGRRRKQKQSEIDTTRQSSALSRDSGVNIDIENVAGDHSVKSQKVSVVSMQTKQPNIRLELPSRLSSYGSETSLNNLLPSDDCDISNKKTSKLTEVRCIDDTLSRNSFKNMRNTDIIVETINRESIEPVAQFDPSCLPVV